MFKEVGTGINRCLGQGWKSAKYFELSKKCLKNYRKIKVAEFFMANFTMILNNRRKVTPLVALPLVAFHDPAT